MIVSIRCDDDAFMPPVDSENFRWMSTRISAIPSFSNPDSALISGLRVPNRSGI